jgi:hypothetical protein
MPIRSDLFTFIELTSLTWKPLGPRNYRESPDVSAEAAWLNRLGRVRCVPAWSESDVPADEIFQQHLPDFTATVWEAPKLLYFCFESKAMINAEALKSISGITRSQH